MPRASMRGAMLTVLMFAVAVATVLVGGPRFLYATGLWVDGGSPTPDPSLYEPTPTPTPSPVAVKAVAGPANVGSLPDPATLSARLEAVPATVIGSPAAVVTDQLGNTVLVASNADRPQMPASTMKLLTAAAAIYTLGPDHRFRTTVVSSPSGIVLVGGGDPYLRGTGKATYPNRSSIVDLADLTAAALAQTGRTSVTLGYDDTLFSGPAWNAAWLPGYEQFVTPISSLWIDEGIVNGIHGDTPALSAATTFAELLRERGIEVTSVAAQEAVVTEEIAGVDSLPVDLIVQEMLNHSNNDAAEVLFRQIAVASGQPGSNEAASAAMAKQLTDLGLWHEGMVIEDGSGLSRGNRATANVLAKSVSYGFQNPQYRSLITGLPTAGGDGTLGQRFDDQAEGAGRGAVRAKTGTLTGNHSLAGFTYTVDGSVVVFAFMAGDVAANQDPAARDWLDRESAAVASCGC